MKAISVKQPHANLLASGKKQIETRKWQTQYRGRILVCVSKKPDNKGGPVGMAICTIELFKITRFVKEDVSLACCDWYPGFAWWVRAVKLINPFPVKGQLGIFDVNYEEG